MGDGRPGKACGLGFCKVSTSVDDRTLTFGHGELDEYGFWEHPCRPCAKHFELVYPDYNGRVWPAADANKETQVN